MNKNQCKCGKSCKAVSFERDLPIALGQKFSINTSYSCKCGETWKILNDSKFKGVTNERSI